MFLTLLLVTSLISVLVSFLVGDRRQPLLRVLRSHSAREGPSSDYDRALSVRSASGICRRHLGVPQQSSGVGFLVGLGCPVLSCYPPW
jgi:hypothetical protein